MDIKNPDEVLRYMFAELVRRRAVIDKSARYYDGLHRLAFTSEKFLEAFGGMFGAFADNWCAIVVDAVEERLSVQGFRVGELPAADDNAKRLWEENDLDAQSSMGHTDALVQGATYATVWQREETASTDDAATPEITVDSAATTIVWRHPKFRQRRTHGLRTWIDEDGFEHAELFTPERVYMFRSKTKRSGSIIDPIRSQWVGEDQLDAASNLDVSSSMPNPLGVVPIVEFLNRPRLYVSPRVGWAAHSEISSVIPIQDAVNKIIADMLIASEFAAYPQRWVTGWEPDEDPETDAILPPTFKSGAGVTWWTESKEAKFGAFPTVSIEQYVKVVEMLVQHIASISSTPPHYLRASADRLSGESLKSAETGLVAKVVAKQTGFGASWEEVMRLAGKVAQIPSLANAQRMETIWKDPETRTESEHVDAVMKKQTLDVPNEQLWEELGYSPEQIKRFPAMRARSSISEQAATGGERARLFAVPGAPGAGAPPPPPMDDGAAAAG